MKKHLLLTACASAVILVAGNTFAQPGRGKALPPPHAAGGQSGFTGPTVMQGQGGFTGPSATAGSMAPVTVSQTATFADRTPLVLKGNIVQAISHDRYIFRDATGDIVIRIKHDLWWDLTVSPSDTVEIYGEYKRDKRNWQIVHVDVRVIRKA